MASEDNGDEELFLREMADVAPLQIEKKVTLKPQRDSELAIQARRDSATQYLDSPVSDLSTDHVELLDSYYPLSFKRAGIQHGVYRKLKQGKYSQDARLDLHRLTVAQASKEVFDFIKESVAYDLRTLIIVHGRGSHGDGDYALLKSYVNKWLMHMSEVQAYCSAQPQHGGLGAVYVLLAKSERKKKENRERLSRGRTVMGD